MISARNWTNSPDDQRVLSGFFLGRREETLLIYKDHYKAVSAWIRKKGGNEADIEDVFQEALMVLYDNLSVSDFQLTCSLRTFLFSVCKNLWLKKLRDNSKEIRWEIGDPGKEEVANWMNEYDAGEIKEKNLELALEKIGEPCRSLLNFYYFKNLNMEEIAEEMGYTNAANAKNQKYKCFLRLKKFFFELMEQKNSD